jgi:hypothetical protein
MDNLNKISEIIGQPESINLEYKAILPPSRLIAQLICAFANTEGGYIILGITETPKGLEIIGLSEDFHASPITHKAIDLLTPKPTVDYGYVTYDNKKIYAIWIEKSIEVITLEGKKYIRNGAKTIVDGPIEKEIQIKSYKRLSNIKAQFISYSQQSTDSKSKFIEHYISVVNIINDIGNLLYPISPSDATLSHEGKILSRILFSSCVDNFESYLSDILFEIYLAKPDALKSDTPVTVKEVLDCSDLQDFISYFAKQKIGKLQKGSVKGFIKANQVISKLNVLDDKSQSIIEEILQIRHLYSHRNGIIDDKFIKNVSGNFQLNTEHIMSTEQICDKICYLAEIVQKIDIAAIGKYSLSYIN